MSVECKRWKAVANTLESYLGQSYIKWGRVSICPSHNKPPATSFRSVCGGRGRGGACPEGGALVHGDGCLSHLLVAPAKKVTYLSQFVCPSIYNPDYSKYCEIRRHFCDPKQSIRFWMWFGSGPNPVIFLLCLLAMCKAALHYSSQQWQLQRWVIQLLHTI